MAVSLTRNLKLRVDSNLTDDAKFNLEKIDSLGAVYSVDSSEDAIVRSQQNIIIQPRDPDVGGIGSGGTVQIGTVDQTIDTVSFYANAIDLSTGPGLLDQATGGNKNLYINYKSDINGSVDTSANRLLNIDVQGADRNLTLGGDLTILSNSVTIEAPLETSWTLPVNTGSSGQILTTDGNGTLSWTSASATNLTGLADVTISSPSSGEVLTYNGSEWVNQTPAGTNQLAATWSTADGTTKSIVHNFGTRNIMVQVIDPSDSYRNVEVDEITRPTDNSIFLSAASAPSTAWTVLLTSIS